MIALPDSDAAETRLQEACERNEKGDRNGPLSIAEESPASVLPAIDASASAAAVELDQPLLPHRERRVEEGFLIELRKRFLEALHRDTSAALAQHLRDGGLNGCGSTG